MAVSRMLSRVALVRTDDSDNLSASFIRVVRIGELGTTLAVNRNAISSILVTLMKDALSSSETSVLRRATRRNIPEDAFFHNHRRENLKFYTENLSSLNHFYIFWGFFDGNSKIIPENEQSLNDGQ
jgi:hypothetical protein